MTVRRSHNGPTFLPAATYQKTISETYSVGDVILQVTAVDNDRNVSLRLLLYFKILPF